MPLGDKLHLLCGSHQHICLSWSIKYNPHRLASVPYQEKPNSPSLKVNLARLPSSLDAQICSSFDSRKSCCFNRSTDQPDGLYNYGLHLNAMFLSVSLFTGKRTKTKPGSVSADRASENEPVCLPLRTSPTSSTSAESCVLPFPTAPRSRADPCPIQATFTWFNEQNPS